MPCYRIQRDISDAVVSLALSSGAQVFTIAKPNMRRTSTRLVGLISCIDRVWLVLTILRVAAASVP
jgi:hypothetical protein